MHYDAFNIFPTPLIIMHITAINAQRRETGNCQIHGNHRKILNVPVTLYLVFERLVIGNWLLLPISDLDKGGSSEVIEVCNSLPHP